MAQETSAASSSGSWRIPFPKRSSTPSSLLFPRSPSLSMAKPWKSQQNKKAPLVRQVSVKQLILPVRNFTGRIFCTGAVQNRALCTTPKRCIEVRSYIYSTNWNLTNYYLQSIFMVEIPNVKDLLLYNTPNATYN